MKLKPNPTRSEHRQEAAAPGARAVAAAAALVLLAAPPAAPAAVSLETVAVSGQAAPGLPFTRTALLERGSTWGYLDDGSDLPTAAPDWASAGFDDAAWASGPAPLGYGESYIATVVSFGDDDSNKHITTYFRTTFEVTAEQIEAAGTEGAQLILELLRDDSAAVYLNGELLVTSNLPATFGFDTRASGTTSSESTWRTFDLDPARLLVGTNQIAAEVHQASPTSSDTSLDAAIALTVPADPAAGGDGSFAGFSQPLINARGDVVFEAELEHGGGVDETNDAGIWRALKGGGLHRVARTGEPVNVDQGYLPTLGQLAGPALDNLGHVAFWGRLVVDPEDANPRQVFSYNDTAIWLTGPHDTFGRGLPGDPDLWMIIRENNRVFVDAAGTDSARVENHGVPSLSPNGTVSFTGELDGTDWEGVGGAWFLPRPDAPPNRNVDYPLLLAHDLLPAPNLAGVTFGETQAARFGATGQVTFTSKLTGAAPDVTAESDSALWFGPAGGLQLLAREGSGAPQVPGAPYFEFGSPTLNTGEDVAYWGGLVGEVRTGGIWLKKNGATAPLALAGDRAPGLPAGAAFEAFFDPALSDRGVAAFLAYLKDAEGVVDETNNQGIWSGGAGHALRLVARSGDPAPGAAAGTHFSAFGSPVINRLGMVVFSALVAHEDSDVVGPANDFGVWGLDSNGQLCPLLREGDAYTVAPGDDRTVAEVSASALNDAGEVLLTVDFTDGSSAVVRATLPVPALRDFGGWADQIADPDRRAPGDDADGDGIINLIEFALGLDPGADNAPVDNQRVAVIELDGGGYAFALAFRRPVNAEGVTYVVEISTDLVNWISGPGASAEVSAQLVGGGMEEVIWRDLIEATGDTRCFLRLRVIAQ